MCKMFVGRQRPRLYPSKFDRDRGITKIYFRDNYKVLEEAPKLNVCPYIVVGWMDGELPSYTCWQAAAADLMAMPYESLWAQRYIGRQLIMTKRWKCKDYALYETMSGEPAGLGWPQPIFDMDLSYAEYEQGIGYAGFGVAPHEIGHLLDFVYNGHNGDATFPPFSRSPWWMKRHSEIDWPSPMTRKDPTEAFADSYAIFCLQRQPDGYKRLPFDIDPKISEAWLEICQMWNWPSVRKNRVITNIQDVPNITLRSIKKELSKGIKNALTFTK